ncbi:hypothetical protein [Salipiger abyssi]|uniref:hypothetical protein n=1 Tax=Salipiger abyssi TaxID=1250539 RepID=UPI001A8FD7F9|nr:hypothetical protein [Salipiger abyssi]MBN9890538.1 hypothetical protein [Salipiger abyssi]
MGFLHVEGINFDSCIFDTSDISTIRGGSMLLESLGSELSSRLTLPLVDAGAGRAVFALPEGGWERIAGELARFLGSDPWRHFSIITGTGETRGAARSSAILSAPSQWSIPPFDAKGATGPDPEDFKRPATKCETDKDGKKTRLVSASVKERRDVARRKRPVLYPEDGGLVPPQSFESIVVTTEELPFVVRNKIAVVVVDGMGGGKLRAAYERAGGVFYTAKTAFYDRLAERIRTWMAAEGLVLREKGVTAGQCDVLLWGGDDMTFFMPARKVMSFVRLFLDYGAGPFDPAGVPKLRFPHRLGVVIAHVRTPFRQMWHMAGQAEHMVKQGMTRADRYGESAVAFALFESDALPHGALSEHWHRIYGGAHEPEAEVFTRAEFARFVDFCRETRAGEDGSGDALSLSQIYRVLQLGRLSGAEGSPPRSLTHRDTDRAVRNLLASHLERAGRDVDALNAWGEVAERRSLAVLLAQVAQLAPYVEASFPRI